MFRKLLCILSTMLLLAVVYATGWLSDSTNSPFNSGNAQKIIVDQPLANTSWRERKSVRHPNFVAFFANDLRYI